MSLKFLQCLPLLWQANVKGETPLHIAARYGHAPIVEVLIGCAKALQEGPKMWSRRRWRR